MKFLPYIFRIWEGKQEDTYLLTYLLTYSLTHSLTHSLHGVGYLKS
jgi:hypothetical protein